MLPFVAQPPGAHGVSSRSFSAVSVELPGIEPALEKALNFETAKSDDVRIRQESRSTCGNATVVDGVNGWFVAAGTPPPPGQGEPGRRRGEAADRAPGLIAC